MPLTGALAVGGALLGGMGGSSGSSSTDIPGWLKQYIVGNGGILNEAQNLYDNRSTVGLTPDQIQAQDMIRSNALSNPFQNPMQDFALDTLSGKYLDGGQFMQNYGNDILEGVDSNFARAGRTGSGYHSKVAASELGKTASQLYDTERNRQMQTLGMIPQMDAMRYNDANQLMQVGNMNYGQQMYENNADWDALTQYANMVYGAPHGQTQSMSRNPMAGALGGAMTGLSLAKNWNS